MSLDPWQTLVANFKSTFDHPVEAAKLRAEAMGAIFEPLSSCLTILRGVKFASKPSSLTQFPHTVVKEAAIGCPPDAVPMLQPLRPSVLRRFSAASPPSHVECFAFKKFDYDGLVELLLQLVGI